MVIAGGGNNIIRNRIRSRWEDVENFPWEGEGVVLHGI